MDARSQFYINCLRWEAGITKKVFTQTNLKNFHKITQSEEYIDTVESGGVYIGEGEVEGTWVAVYEEHEDEDSLIEYELVFEHKPTVEEAEYVIFLTDIESYLSDPKLKPYVPYNGKKTHWTELPSNNVKEKWEQFILLRDEQENARKA